MSRQEISRQEIRELPKSQRVPAAEAYRRWSSVYDSEVNPMISLEQRFLESLLPRVKDRDVVDLGCGTGRWLEVLASKSPRSLIGVDSCEAMLDIAEKKLQGRADLMAGEAEAARLEDASADVILCSFVMSYISNIADFAAQIRMIARSGADIFVTDLHPESELKFGWRRGFRDGEEHVDVQTCWRSLDSIVASFDQHGIRPVALLEIPFGDEEFEILKRAGKAGLLEELRNQPVIYILQLRAVDVSVGDAESASRAGVITSISGARPAFGPAEAVRAEIDFEDGRIATICAPAGRVTVGAAESRSIDLSGFLVLPGLINAHDHLEFALFPRLGRGGYENCAEWAKDIHRPNESPVREHRSIPKSTRLWWGAIRNLLCGVTTVCNHNPYMADVFENDFPIRVVREFGWAHSLAVEPDVARKHATTPADHPFIIHLGEGVDRSSADELYELDRMGTLDERTIVVHGLALDPVSVSLVNARGAALVWCPSSNAFLFGRTHEAETIRSVRSVALGSDSSLTAEGDLLDEIRYAREATGLRANELYAQVTSRAADVLRLQSGQGTIRAGAVADVIAIRDVGLSPAERLARSTYHDIELVVVGGRVQLASPAMRARLQPEVAEGLEPLRIDGEVRWIRAPLTKLFGDAVSALGNDLRMNGRSLSYGAQ